MNLLFRNHFLFDQYNLNYHNHFYNEYMYTVLNMKSHSLRELSPLILINVTSHTNQLNGVYRWNGCFSIIIIIRSNYITILTSLDIYHIKMHTSPSLSPGEQIALYRSMISTKETIMYSLLQSTMFTFIILFKTIVHHYITTVLIKWWTLMMILKFLS